MARILGVLGSTGAMRVEPAALQPADVLLDLYGEDIRARAFVTRDEGAEMMLRPDFTVPIVRLHMDAGAEPARYVYCGPVWRRQEFGSDRPREYLQAGFEVFEAGDPAAHDAEVLGLIAAALGDAPVELVTGDLGLVLAAIDTLDTSPARKAALRRHMWRPRRFHALLHRFGDGHAAVRAARAELLAAEAAGATAGLVASAGTAVGLRDPADVAARVARLAEEAATPPLAAAEVARIEAVLAVAGTATAALARLRVLARGLPGLGAAVDRFAGRLDALAARGIAPAAPALRGELRANLARVLRRLRLRRPAARPGRPAAHRHRRALRRAHPGARARARHPGGRRHRAARGAGGAMRLRLGVPSKGRLQEETIAWFADRGVTLARSGGGREYRGSVRGVEGIDLVLLAAAEIPQRAGRGPAPSRGHRPGPRARRHPALGGAADRARPDGLRPGRPRRRGAGVLDRRRRHVRPRRRGRRLPRPPRPPAPGGDQVPPPRARILPGARVADYQLVDSQGATEGSVKNLTAEVVADITTTGSTLRDNHLRVLDDGLILESQATLFVARDARWTEQNRAALAGLSARLGLPPPAVPQRPPAR